MNKPEAMKAKKISLSLFDDELKIIDRLSKQRRYFKRSKAIRQIIHEWAASQAMSRVFETKTAELVE